MGKRKTKEFELNNFTQTYRAFAIIRRPKTTGFYTLRVVSIDNDRIVEVSDISSGDYMTQIARMQDAVENLDQ